MSTPAPAPVTPAYTYATDLIEDTRRFVKGMEILLEHPEEITVATTPHEVVYTEDKMKLMHYIPTVERTSPVPVFIIYACVNRYYILDLQPEKSVVRKLLDEGLDVYIIDWGYPSGSDRYLTLNDYVEGYVNNAVDKIRELSGSDKVTLFGVCQGGTISVMYATLHPEKVKNLVTLVTPINFDTDKGLLHIWAKALDVDRVVDFYGIVPGDLLNIGFLLTDPFRLLIDKYVGMFERLECKTDDKECQRRNEEIIKNFLRMEKWIFDSPGQAGEAYRQFMKDLYQKNLLIKNEMMLDGKRIDLRKITMPLLNVMAETDHLVPNEASLPLADAVSSEDKETLVFPTGHIGIFVGSRSQKEVVPRIAEWLKPRSLPEGAQEKGKRARGKSRGRTG
ncbi:poly(R)-hydroxyalkanoic acid synthase, class III, PhaC subunit [Candidatus Methanoperedens nitroreducens]|uniref:Poly(3-hydroxyalkanoate) polymerase subunit PhaC n=1 Tax=Candidatus Methanoperedens nitratireducens TaxID=1392998 RepID=A0A062VD38_9EURY|nr:class III poly(R)-hydroxyalkanoic acid synthase subunit PhaC [Candidatus Methanoperedens nitroreducens]KCZ73574.1 poly(R)-hydroxyalkanoic acid synthase, class III, PhaC subunit [Candidatus Methanoperedens nitroreducens]MDJ1422466.1 class III poly(R)-hydroxyalkanoic acid synthase subunit PhaC [Candidatus Methanoperedens sp.]